MNHDCVFTPTSNFEQILISIVDKKKQQDFAERAFYTAAGLYDFQKTKFQPWSSNQKDVMAIATRYGVDLYSIVVTIPENKDCQSLFTKLIMIEQLHFKLVPENIIKDKILFLIQLGFDLSRADNKGVLPLFYAKKKEVMMLLTTAGVCINQLNKDGDTCVMSCFKNEDSCFLVLSDYFNFIKDFITFGGDLNIKNYNGQNILNIIFQYWKNNITLEMVRFLIEQCSVPIVVDQYGDTLFHYMAKFLHETNKKITIEMWIKRKKMWNILVYLSQYLDLYQKNNDGKIASDYIPKEKYCNLSVIDYAVQYPDKLRNDLAAIKSNI